VQEERDGRAGGSGGGSELLAKRRKGVPLYLTLRDDLAARIAARHWGVAAPLPAELQLARDYGVALGTMRRAIEELVDEGLLERVQGVGTFIRRPDFSNSMYRFLRFRSMRSDEWLPESRILSKRLRAMPAHVARHLDREPGSPGLTMRRLRLFEGVPHVAEHIWVPTEGFQSLVDLPKERIGSMLYRFYEEACGQIVTSAEENLRVARAGRVDVKLLGVESGAPIVVIERTAYDIDRRPLEWRLSHGRADDFSYKIEIR